MKHPFRKKWHTYSLLGMLTLLLVFGSIFYLIRYRFNHILEYIVTQESKGKYAFNADKMEISLWHKRIVMDNASLIYLDTVTEATHYDIHIPEIYFSIASWKQLLFNKKIMIDSFSVIRPDLEIYSIKKKMAARPSAFRPRDILRYLEQTLSHLNARSLSIHDASFTYRNQDGSPPIHGEQINLSLTNFTKVNNEDSHLFGSDNVEFSLGKQDWPLANGNQEIHFKGLSFKSRNQKVEIDSFSFLQKAKDGQDAISISAEKFFFNSRHLPAIYQKDELLMDTLFCLRPVFSVPGQSRKAAAATAATDIRSPLFKRINIQFIRIIDGELSLAGRDGERKNTVADKTNLSVYNLTLDPGKNPQLSTDSVRISVKKIQFLSKDSLFQLSIDEFVFNRQDVIFKNVLFSPSIYNHTGKSINFKAPELILREINMEELMRKRIQANSAELIAPEIIFQQTGGEKNRSTSAKTPAGNNLSSLYQTLHGLPQLIDVPEFRITNGSLQYAPAPQMVVSASNINVRLLPNKIFVSDSLINIKHAIPDLRIGRCTIRTGALDMVLHNFIFSGIRQFTQIDSLSVSLANGTKIKGKNVSWLAFNWDLFQKNQTVQIDQAATSMLIVQAKTSPAHDESKKDLPVISIGSLKIGKALVSIEAPGSQTRFQAANAELSKMRSAKQFFEWEFLKADLTNLWHEGRQLKATADLFHLTNTGESSLENLKIISGNEQAKNIISLPLIKIKVAIRSSNVNSVFIQSLVSPQADWYTYSNQKPGGEVKLPVMPLNLALGHLAIDAVHVHMVREKVNNISDLQGSGKLTADDIRTVKGQEKMISFSGIGLELSALRLRQSGILLNLPDASVKLADGSITRLANGQTEIKSDAELSWKNARLEINKDSAEINVRDIAGDFAASGLRLNPADPIPWVQLAAKTRVSGNGLSYKGKKSNASIRRFSWHGDQQLLSLDTFDFLPAMDRDEAFRTAQWQNDYMQVRGRKLQVSGIRWHLHPGDSVLGIAKLIADGITLNTYRDRRIPFRHGVEKSMPTKLISALPLPLLIDTIWLKDNQVNVHEFAVATQLWSDIPLEEINGYITHIKSRDNKKDQLSLLASAQLFKNPIRHFSYQESYGDSLSYFSANALLTHADLTSFTSLTMAMAAVRIKKGYADSIYTQWAGNKYASEGEMHLSFRHLKIKMYNKKDSTRSGLVPTVISFVANLLLPAKHNKNSLVFVERDREKFVFNYWVKAQTSGFLSSLGIKTSKKYMKEYALKAEEYGLPEPRKSRP